MPVEEELDKFNERYFLNAHGVTERDFVTEAYFCAVAQSRIDYILEFTEPCGGNLGTILEIGPGGGHLARKWLAMTPGTGYWAVEADSDCHEVLAGAGVKFGQIPGHADLVIMSHVLEHVPDPRLFIDTHTAKLVENGYLFVEVPCEDYLYKDSDEPHLLFFNKQALAILLQNCGFEILDISCCGNEHAWYSARGALSVLVEKLRLTYLSLRFAHQPDNPELEAILSTMYAIAEKKDCPSAWLRVIARKLG